MIVLTVSGQQATSLPHGQTEAFAAWVDGKCADCGRWAFRHPGRPCVRRLADAFARGGGGGSDPRASHRSARSGGTSISRFIQKHAKEAPPDWYQVAHDAEAAAGEAKEATYLKVAATPALMRAGQALKLRLIAQAYGITLDDPPLRSSEADDLVAVLIRSLANDLGPDDHHLRA